MRNLKFLMQIFLFFASFFFAELGHAAQLDMPYRYCETTVSNPSVCDVSLDSPIWKDAYSLMKPPEFNEESDYVWYAVPLDGSKNIDNNSVLFSTTGEAVEVFFDGAPVYAYGEKEDILGDNGSKWHIITLPKIQDGKHWLMMKFYSPVHSQLGKLNYFYLDNEIDNGQRIFLFDALNVAALSVALGMLVIMHLFMKEEHVSRKLYVACVSLLTVFIAWTLSVLNMKYLFLRNATPWWLLFMVTTYILPATANSIVFTILHGRGKRFVGYFALVFLAITVAVMAGELAGFHTMLRALPLFYILLLVCDIPLLCFECYEAYKGNIYAKGAILSTIAFPLGACIDGVSAFTSISWRVLWMPIGIFGFIFFVIFILKAQVAREKEIQLQSENLKKEIDESIRKATTDRLTGCLNRTSFHQLLGGACNDAVNKQLPLSIIMLDIDHFKRFNDTYGHEVGDSVLRNFSACIREKLSPAQPLVRWGGEEFVVICPNLDLRQAMKLAESIRLHVSESKLHEELVTSSVGVATWHGKKDTPQDLFRRMDEALYFAKEHGRNRVFTEEILG